MAVNGEITGTAYRSNGNANSDYKFLLKWTRNSYSIENNTSNITITLSVQRMDTYADSAANLNKKPRVTLTINDIAQTNLSIGYINTRNGKISTFMTWTGEISHDNDGSFEKNVAASFELDGTSSLGSGSVNGTLAIDTIPRATLLTIFSCNTPYFDGALAYTRADPASESFTHSISLYIEGREQPIFSCEEDAEGFDKTNFKIGENSLSEIYMTLGDKDRGKLILGLKTKSGSTQIGEEQKKELSLLIPESVVPVVEKITLTPSANKGVLLQGMNQVQISVAAAAGKGTAIESYTITIKNGSVEIYNNTLSNLPISLGPFSQSGILDVFIIVKDKRGRESQSKVETIECQEYSLPFISDFKAYRGNENGDENSDGTYLVYSYQENYTKIEDNSATVTLYFDGAPENRTSPINLGENTASHQIYLTIEDKYYSGSPTATKTILAASRILNIASDGKGLAIGKKAINPVEKRDTGLFECQWDSEFNGKVDIKNDVNIQGKLKVDGELEIENTVTFNNTVNVNEININGDLTLNGIQSLKSIILEFAYPVGSIYQSTKNNSPANFLGGSWERLKDRFLLGAGNSYDTYETVEETGGAATHSHGLTSGYAQINHHDGKFYFVEKTVDSYTAKGSGTASGANIEIAQSEGILLGGSTDSGSSLPPYLVVYMWKRTA